MEHPAQKIKFLMRTNNCSVHDLADKLGIPIESMRDILDEREMPPSSLLARIVAVFGAREAYFGDLIAPRKAAADREESLPGAFQARDAAIRPIVPVRGPHPASHGDAEKKVRSPRVKRHRKLDLTEIALRQQALIDLLIGKNVIASNELEVRLEILRAKIIARKQSVEKTR